MVYRHSHTVGLDSSGLADPAGAVDGAVRKPLRSPAPLCCGWSESGDLSRVGSSERSEDRAAVPRAARNEAEPGCAMDHDIYVRARQ